MSDDRQIEAFAVALDRMKKEGDKPAVRVRVPRERRFLRWRVWRVNFVARPDESIDVPCMRGPLRIFDGETGREIT